MRVPLAVFCTSFFITMLAAAQLPAAVIFTAAGVLAAVFVIAMMQARRRRKTVCPPAVVALVLSGMTLALAWRGVYHTVVVRPVAELDGRRAQVWAVVQEVAQGFSEETVNAVLQIEAVEGYNIAPFRVQVRNLPLLSVGERLHLPLHFYDYTSSKTRYLGYAKGQLIAAAPDGEIQRAGTSHSPVTRLRQLQYAASDNIQKRLPQRLSGTVAAMSLGDRRYLQPQVVSQYRTAGLSHLLVVSGFHLSLLVGSMYRLLLRFLRRQWAVCGTLFFVVLFALFAGMGASVVRSAFMWGLILLADGLGRKAHAPTSLALALFVMTLFNPYAAVDVGLLLSATATAGLLCANGVEAGIRRYLSRRFKNRVWMEKATAALLPSALATCFTLPVLVGAEMGVSLLSLPANLIALPLVPAIVVSGFVMALPSSLFFLNWLGVMASLVGGVLLRGLELVCLASTAVPGSYIPVGGLFAMCVLALAYGLVFLGLKQGRVKVFSAVAAGLLVLALGLNAVLGAGTVRVIAAGSSTPSLVVIQKGQAVVLYRSRQSAKAVEEALWRYGARQCVLLIDLRQTAQSTEYGDKFSPQQAVVVQEDLLAGRIYTPLPDVTVTVVRQKNGDMACVDVAGYKIGCYTGTVDTRPYVRLNVLLAGSGQAKGESDALLCQGAVPRWVEEADGTPLLISDGTAGLWLRPGKSVIFREVLYGDTA